MRVLLVLVLLASTASAKPWTWKQQGEYLHDVEVAPDGSIATYANNELVRFARDGKVKSKRSFPPTALVKALAFAPDGELIAVGYFEKALDLGGGELAAEDRDGFVARYKPDGTLRWAVQLKSSTMANVLGVAVTGDRVLAVGMFRDKMTVGGKTFEGGDAGFALVTDADGKLLRVEKVQAELAAACATGDNFVVGGRDRTKGDTVFVQGVTKDLAARWSYAGGDGEVAELACRADGTSFAATFGENAKNDYSMDVAILELDGAGKLARSIPIETKGRDKALSIAATAAELVVTTSHSDGNAPVRSQLTRFGSKGKAIKTEVYKAAETVWVRATYRGKDVVLAGEVQRGAKVTVRGTKLVGPTVFVSAP